MRVNKFLSLIVFCDICLDFKGEGLFAHFFIENF